MPSRPTLVRAHVPYKVVDLRQPRRHRTSLPADFALDGEAAHKQRASEVKSIRLLDALHACSATELTIVT